MSTRRIHDPDPDYLYDSEKETLDDSEAFEPPRKRPKKGLLLGRRVHFLYQKPKHYKAMEVKFGLRILNCGLWSSNWL